MQLRNMHQQACNVVQLCSMKPARGTTHQQACNPHPPTRTALESVPVRRLPRRSSHLSCCSAETMIGGMQVTDGQCVHGAVLIGSVCEKTVLDVLRARGVLQHLQCEDGARNRPIQPIVGEIDAREQRE
jgi:hypothetical protein